MQRSWRLLAAPIACVLLAACGGSTSGHAPARHAVAPQSQLGYRTAYGPQAHSPTFGLPPHGLTAQRPTLSLAPTVLQLDSVSDFSVFSGLPYRALAGYLPPSSWPTYSQYRAHFKTVVAVDVQSYAHGIAGAALSCLDIEPGDAQPSEATGWIEYEVQHHFKPCVYGSLSEFGAIDQAIAAAHVHVHVFRWDADWTYSPHLDSGFDATQWTDHFANRNIDGSQVTLAFANLIAHKPPAPTFPRCFHHGWSQPRTKANQALCNRVRKHDSYLGVVIKHESGYLAVSARNRARLLAELRTVNGRIGVEQHQRSVAASALAADLRKFHF